DLESRVLQQAMLAALAKGDRQQLTGLLDHQQDLSRAGRALLAQALGDLGDATTARRVLDALLASPEDLAIQAGAAQPLASSQVAVLSLILLDIEQLEPEQNTRLIDQGRALLALRHGDG